MTINLHPNDLMVDHPASQETLDYALKRGRFLGGHDLIDRSRPIASPVGVERVAAPAHQNNLCLNGGGMKELERAAIELAMEESGGSVRKAAQRLKMDRSRLYYRLNVWKKEAQQLAVALLLCALTGCVTKHTASVTPIEDRGQVAVLRSTMLPTMSANAVAPPVPRGESITLAWDASPDADLYRLLTSTNKLDWVVVAETTATSARATNLFAPVWFAATAARGEDESVFSNLVGWLGNESVVTITAESSADLNIWSDYAQIFKGTNVTGMNFYRTRADTVTRRIIE